MSKTPFLTVDEIDPPKFIQIDCDSSHSYVLRPIEGRAVIDYVLLIEDAATFADIAAKAGYPELLDDTAV